MVKQPHDIDKTAILMRCPDWWSSGWHYSHILSGSKNRRKLRYWAKRYDWP